MAAEVRVEMVMLNEVVDASIDEELLFDYEDDGEIHLIAATAAFMRRDLNRIVVFVPSLLFDALPLSQLSNDQKHKIIKYLHES